MTIERWREHIEQAGGMVHRNLQLLVGDEAEHGQISLAGVDKDTLSLVVPFSLGEWYDTPGPWIVFLQFRGYDVFSPKLRKKHVFWCGYMPLIGAANHSDDPETMGKIVETDHAIELYGTTFQYSKDKQHLKDRWGIG